MEVVELLSGSGEASKVTNGRRRSWRLKVEDDRGGEGVRGFWRRVVRWGRRGRSGGASWHSERAREVRWSGGRQRRARWLSGGCWRRGRGEGESAASEGEERGLRAVSRCGVGLTESATRRSRRWRSACVRAATTRLSFYPGRKTTGRLRWWVGPGKELGRLCCR